MKKHLLGAVLLSGLVLFGCESNEKPVSNGESVANESVAEQKGLTATEIESYILSQLPDKYDWSCGYSEESNLIIFVYKGFYLDLMDAQKYLDASKFQTDWYAETNQMIRFNKRMEKELRAMGYDAIVSAPEWVENGMPAILQGTFIYGVIPQSITETEDGKYEAIIDWYTPFAFTDDVEEENPEMENKARVFVYSVTQDFDFQWNKRGWWVCVSNEIADYTLSDVFYVDTYTSLLGQN